MIVLPLLDGAFALSALMAGAWLVQRRTDQSGWVDAIWSFAVGIVGVGLALIPLQGSDRQATRAILVAVLAAAWSLRLGLHIVGRNLKGGEDPRYRALRDEWGTDFPRRLFWFLQIQAAAAFVLTISIFVAAGNSAPFPNIGDILGAAILIVAIAGETVADRQLERFRTEPANRGRVCETGLWGVSRHPNYFFEWLGWLAYPFIAVGLPPANVYGLIALVGPLFMYSLLAHVSGIPPLEAHMARSRGVAFEVYRKRVNAFFPGPPRQTPLVDRSSDS